MKMLWLHNSQLKNMTRFHCLNWLEATGRVNKDYRICIHTTIGIRWNAYLHKQWHPTIILQTKYPSSHFSCLRHTWTTVHPKNIFAFLVYQKSQTHWSLLPFALLLIFGIKLDTIAMMIIKIVYGASTLEPLFIRHHWKKGISNSEWHNVITI